VAGDKLASVTINTVSIDDVDTAGMSDSDAAVAIQTAINAKADQSGVYAEIGTGGVINLVSTKAEQSLVVGGAWTGGSTVAASTVKDAALAADVETSGLDVTSFKASQRSINLAQDALSTINSARADLGAIQNRFQSTIANLSSTSENMSAARGRIQDADFASETASMTRSQILQQAGTAMLAQANSLPNGVLALLRG
jgi:flagellin